MGMSPEQFRAMEQRCQAAIAKGKNLSCPFCDWPLFHGEYDSCPKCGGRFNFEKPKPCDDESKLHRQILDYCKQNGWIALHSSMAHETYRPVGEWDFTILMPNRVLMIECKRKGGKLTPEQNGMIYWAAKLGHAVHLVYSFEEFLKLL